MVVNHIGTLANRGKRSKKGGAKRSKPLFVDSSHGHHANAVNHPLASNGLIASHNIDTGPIIASDIMPKRSHTTGQLRHDNLNATLASAIALVSDHCNLKWTPH